MMAVGEGDPGVVVATLRQALEALTRLSNERASLEEALKALLRSLLFRSLSRLPVQPQGSIKDPAAHIGHFSIAFASTALCAAAALHMQQASGMLHELLALRTLC